MSDGRNSDVVCDFIQKKRSASESTAATHTKILPPENNKHVRQEVCKCSVSSGGSERCRYMPEKVDLHSVSIKTNETKHIVRSCYGYSMQGYCPGASKKQNQDSLIMLQDPKSGALLVVCLDGHGLYGDHISQFFKSRLETRLFQHELFDNDVQSAITHVLSTIESELRGGVDGVGQYSGSTMALALLRGDQLLTANIGDSRVVLARQRKHKHHHHRERSSSASSHRELYAERLSPDMVVNATSPSLSKSKHSHHRLTAHQLTNDHKPDLRDEHARILSCGGRVFSVRYDDGVIGPARVWLGNTNSPGLAMSRSLGDFVVHEVGVLSTPEFFLTTLDSAVDCFLVVASDGLWDVLSNAEVVALVDKHSHPQDALRALLLESHKRWIHNEEMSDDTTICVIYLQSFVAAVDKDV